MEIVVILAQFLLAIFSGIAELTLRVLRWILNNLGVPITDKGIMRIFGLLFIATILYLGFGYLGMAYGSLSSNKVTSLYGPWFFVPAMILCALFSICLLNRIFPRSRWADANMDIRAFFFLCIELGIVLLTMYCIVSFAIAKSNYAADQRRIVEQQAKCEQINAKSAAREESGKLTDKIANAAIKKLNSARKLDCPE